MAKWELASATSPLSRQKVLKRRPSCFPVRDISARTLHYELPDVLQHLAQGRRVAERWRGGQRRGMVGRRGCRCGRRRRRRREAAETAEDKPANECELRALQATQGEV